MAKRYTFGPFELDERERQLTRGGLDIHLQPRSFDVLQFLLEHAGKLVTKDEIFDAVWKSTVVTESSLTTCIRQIRLALEDAANEPAYIETVLRSGYRFIARVQSVENIARVDTSARQVMPELRAIFRANTSFAIWVGLFIVAVLALVYFL